MTSDPKLLRDLACEAMNMITMPLPTPAIPDPRHADKVRSLASLAMEAANDLDGGRERRRGIGRAGAAVLGDAACSGTRSQPRRVQEPQVRAAIYARVSSAGQRDRDTIASQLAELPAYAASQGWTVVLTVADDGKSAATGKLEARTGFAEILRAAEAHAFDVLVVRDVDRLTRTDDIAERAAILGPFQRAGIRIVTPSGGEIDLRTMFGQLDATLRALYAAEDNRKRRAQIVAGQRMAVSRGRKSRGVTPFGLTHKRLPDGGAEWGIDEERAAACREALTRIAAGESCLSIAEDFERRGVVRRGKVAWTRHRVWDLTRSTHLTGAWRVQHGSVAIAVPTIVEPELLEQARRALVGNRKRGLDRTEHVYLLSKLGRCGACGQSIRMHSGHAAYGTHRAQPARYRCVGRWSPLPPGVTRCDATDVSVPDADERAWAAICRELEDPDLIPALVAIRAERSSDARDWSTDVDGYKKHLARLDRHAAEVLERRRRNLIPEAVMDAELAKLSREREFVAGQLATADGAREATVRATRRLCDADAIVARLRERLATSDASERRAIVLAMVDPGGVVFHGPVMHITMWIERPAASAGGTGSRAQGSGNTPAAIVVGQLGKTTHDSRLMIRVLARVAS